MFKKKATFAVVMAALIVLIAPLAVQLVAQVRTCADLPKTVELCYHGTDIYCEGDAFVPNRCYWTCFIGPFVCVLDCKAQALPNNKD